MKSGRHFTLSNAHLAIEAAIHGHGVALGDSVTTSRLLSEGRLITPFALKVPAPAAFHIVLRNELRNAPIVTAFTDWLAAEIGQAKSTDLPPPAPKTSAKRPRSKKG
jgi:LysR family glycine cleavage system transcriptional activator